MTYFDDFLPSMVLEDTIKFYQDQGFTTLEAGDKSFTSVMPSATLTHLVEVKIAQLLGKPVQNIFSFIRKATDTIDTDWNIHADQHIGEAKPKLAAVLYLSEKPEDVLNGTAFWTHATHGTHLDGNNDEHEEQRKHENDLSQFTLDQMISYKQNRLVIYDANRFHSAYPNKAWKQGRIVMAMFLEC